MWRRSARQPTYRAKSSSSTDAANTACPWPGGAAEHQVVGGARTANECSSIVTRPPSPSRSSTPKSPALISAERAAKLRRFDFCEKPEVPDIDTEDGQPCGSRQQASAAQDGSVPAGCDHEVGGRRELIVGHALADGRERCASRERHDLHVVLRGPLANAGEHRAAVAFGVCDHTDGREVRHVARSSCARSHFADSAAASYVVFRN